VYSKIGIDLIFSFGCDEQDCSLQGSNAGQDEIQKNKGERIERSIVIDIHPER
jgi:hypothetical protein